MAHNSFHIEAVLRTSRVRWFGHVERSVGWISQMQKLDLDTCKKPSRPKKIWNELILNDKRKLDMVYADPLDHSEWTDFEIELSKAQPLVKENGL